MDEKIDKRTTETLRITMPRTMAAKFRERAKYSFDNCFWLMIKFDQELSEIFKRKADDVTKLDLQLIKNDMIQLIKEMYEKGE